MPIQQTRPEVGFHLAGHSQSPFPFRVSDRITELQHQRALVQQQLAWLDREIVRESGDLTIVPEVKAPSAPPSAISSAAAAEAAAAEILAKYRQEAPGSMAKDARKGCILWFIFAMGMMVIFAIGAYFIYANTQGRS